MLDIKHNNKTMALLIVLFLSTAVVFGALASFSTNFARASGELDGQGVSGDPYIIGSLSDFMLAHTNINDDVAGAREAWYELVSDIDLLEAGFSSANVFSQFSGNFNGAGFKLYNLTLNSSAMFTGLFGNLSGATVTNLGLVDCDIYSSEQCVGALAGNALDSVITNCFATGSVVGKALVGGLVGNFEAAASFGNVYISNSYNLCNVTAADYVGEAFTYSSSNIKAGGIAGNIKNANIKQSCNLGEVSASLAVGGIVGYADVSNGANGAHITDCYNTGKVLGMLGGFGQIGGIAGYIGKKSVSSPSESSLINCYNSSLVEGINAGMAGMLVGELGTYGIIDNSYFNSDKISAEAGSATGAVASTSGTVLNVHGLTEAELTGIAAEGNMPGFSDTIWRFNEGGLPTLFDTYKPKTIPLLTFDTISETYHYGDAIPTLAYTVVNEEGGQVEGELIWLTTGNLKTGSNELQYVFVPTNIELYDSISDEFILLVSPRPITLTASSFSKEYDAPDGVLTASITSGTLAIGDTLAELDFNVVRGEGEDVGNYAITVTLGTNPDYDITLVAGNCEITQATPEYEIPELNEIVYSKDRTLQSILLPYGWTWADPTTIPTVDCLAYSAMLDLKSANYKAVVELIPLVTTQATPAIIVEYTGETLRFGDLLPALSLAAGSVSGVVSLNGNQSLKIGNYEYEYSFLPTDNVNYEQVAGKVVLRVERRLASVGDIPAAPLLGESYKYGTKLFDVDLSEGWQWALPDAILEVINSGALVYYDVDNTEIDFAGAVGFNESTNRFEHTIAVVITPRNITIEADDVLATYGYAEQVLTYKLVGGLVGDDELQITISRAIGQVVGEYAIELEVLPHVNYNVVSQNATYTIQKRDIKIRADDLSVNVDSVSAVVYTYSIVSGILIEGDILDLSFSCDSREKAGNYEIDIIPGENPNYNIAVLTGNLTVSETEQSGFNWWIAAGVSGALVAGAGVGLIALLGKKPARKRKSVFIDLK